MRLSTLGVCFVVASVLLGTAAGAPAQTTGFRIDQWGSGGRSFNDSVPDVAYDPNTNTYAHVFVGGAPTATRGIRLKMFNADNRGGVAGGDKPVSASAVDSIHPRVAYIAKTGLFLVTWQSHTNGNDWDILCRAFDPRTKTLGAITTVAATAGVQETAPDIAGDGTKADDDAVVVWDDAKLGIRAVEVEVPTLATVKVLTPAKTLESGADPANNNPSISRSGGATRRVVVAWERSSVLLGVRAYTLDLAVASALSLFPRGTFPEVDGNGSDFAVLFQRPDTTTPALGDIWCLGVGIPRNANQSLIVNKAPSALAASAGQDEKHPAVAFVGSSFLASWSVVNKTDPYGSTRIQPLMPDCSACGNGWTIVRGPQLRVEWNAIASQYNSDVTTTARRARVMYDFYQAHSTGPRSLVQKVEYTVLGGAKTTVAPGCGKGGVLSIPEPVAFGERLTPTLRGADSTATISLVMVGIQGTRFQFSCGPCKFMLGLVSFPWPLSGGQSLPWTFPIACDASLAGAELDFQYIVLSPGTTPCPTFANLSTSNILRVSIHQ